MYEGQKVIEIGNGKTVKKSGGRFYCKNRNCSFFVYILNTCTFFDWLRSEKIFSRSCQTCYWRKSINISVSIYQILFIWFFFLCWNSFRECQISNSSVARITTFLPPSCHDGRQIRNLSSRNFSGILCKPKYHLWSKFFLSIQSIKKIC